MPGVDPYCIFLLTGEGAHSADTDIASLQESPSWNAVAAAMQRLSITSSSATPADALVAWLKSTLGNHEAPGSPLVTTVINVLNADRWRAAGSKPRVAVGHSLGEVAAAYVAGMLPIGGCISAANELGLLGAQRKGAMCFAPMTHAEVDAWKDSELRVAALNGFHSAATEESAALLSVSLCSGAAERVSGWLAAHSTSKKLTPPHPWHHPLYLEVPGVGDGSAFAAMPQMQTPEGSTTTFVSTVRAKPVSVLDATYWREWLTTPVNMLGAIEYVATMPDHKQRKGAHIIETGAHPILTPAATATLTSKGVKLLITVASMRRGKPATFVEEAAKLKAALAGGESTAAAAEGGMFKDAAAAETLVCAVIDALLPAPAKWSYELKQEAFMDIGLDSEGVEELVARLNEKIAPASLMATVTFEKPNVQQLSKFIFEICKPAGASAAKEAAGNMNSGKQYMVDLDAMMAQMMYKKLKQIQSTCGGEAYAINVEQMSEWSVAQVREYFLGHGKPTA